MYKTLKIFEEAVSSHERPAQVWIVVTFGHIEPSTAGKGVKDIRS